MDDERLVAPAQYEAPLLDATDKSLYSFNGRGALTKLCEASDIMTFDRLLETVDGDFVRTAALKIPALLKALEALSGQPEFVAKLPKEARKKLASGEYSWLEAKDGSGLLPILRDATGFSAQARLEEVTSRPDLMDSLVNVAQSNNLAMLADQINQLSDAVERIAAGQHFDRIARFYAARQLYIEAMSMTNPEHRQVALLNAAQIATEAAAALQQELKYELGSLAKTKGLKQLKHSTETIAEGFTRLNDTVQISVFAYSALGERQALLASVRGYQCFIEDTLLSVPDKVGVANYEGVTLAEIMHSCSEQSDLDWRQVPVDIVATCERVIETEREARIALIPSTDQREDEEADNGDM